MTKPYDNKNNCEFFDVASEADMQLGGLPKFIYQLLDALPVQIFIKESAITEERGRLYHYLNKAALERIGWQADEYQGLGDKDAIPNPAEWHKVSKIEQETLDKQKYDYRALKWTGPDSKWRINEAHQYAIVNPEGESVGFCAIAEDISFEKAVDAFSPFVSVFSHEVGNMATGAVADFFRIERLSQRIQDGSVEDAAAALQEINNIAAISKAWLKSSRAISVHIMEGFKDTGRTHTGTAAEILQDTLQATKGFGTLSVCPNFKTIQDSQLQSKNATIAILLELIRNAYKHTPPHLTAEDGRPEIRISGKQSDKYFQWTISNRCDVLKGRISLDGSSNASRLGGLMVKFLLQNAYGITNATDYIDFPDALDEAGWVHVNLRCPLANSDAL